MGERLGSGAVKTQRLLSKFAVLYGHGLWHPQTITVILSKITDHRNKYRNNEKVRNIVRITKMRHRDTE